MVLIHVENDSKDKRKRTIYLTHKGRPLEKKLMKHVMEIKEIAINDDSGSDIKVYMRVLQIMWEKLDSEMAIASSKRNGVVRILFI